VSGRALRTCRTMHCRMALGARVAAMRFARRCGQGGGARGAWLPATMRWRRRRQTAQPSRGLRGAAASSTTIWAPRFHLHFGAQAGDRVARSTPAASRPAAAIQRTRAIVVHRHSAAVRLATAMMPPHRGQRVPRLFATGTSAVGKAHAVAVTPARSSMAATAPSLHLRGASRPQHTPFTRPVATTRQTVVKEQERRPVGADHHLDARALPLVRRRSTPPETDAPRRHQSAAPSPSHVGYGPELAWRRAAPTATPAAGDGADSDAPNAAQRAAARSFPTRETAPEPPAPASRPAPRRLTELDPALVDRLADDVIRRIEKRARIERDRRGF
jgi:hypothetical protein